VVGRVKPGDPAGFVIGEAAGEMGANPGALVEGLNTGALLGEGPEVAGRVKPGDPNPGSTGGTVLSSVG
jgi:hypothetical protein